MNSVLDMTLTGARAGLAAGELAPVDLVRACLAQIDAHEDRVIAWSYLDRDGALRRARELGESRDPAVRGRPLFGIPVGVKDILDVAGMPTEGNCAALRGHVADADATATARLRAAGAIILGKTHTTELALFDPPRTRNPWNTRHTPGGSSSGSAAAVAARMCFAALATQTGASTLRPAAYNGLVGLKAQLGRVSTQGMLKLSDELDHVGIIAIDLTDAVTILDVIAGRDDADPVSLTSDRPVGPARWPGPDAPSLAVVWPAAYRDADSQMRGHFDDVCARLTEGGAKLDVVACPPGFDEITAPFQVLMNVGAAVHHAKLCADSAELVGADVRRTVAAGQQVSAVDYAAALRRQRELRVAFDAALRGYDAVLMPAATGTAPAGIKTGNPVMQIPWSFLGFPALTLPTGLGRDGLPLGTQLVAVPARENDLIAAAAWCEQRVGVVARPTMAAEDD